ncbi:MAG: OmpH family outer membrane protein [Alphaproteobacteria bacterium]|nr:OmpH family outer membrane protein [Alphaproteobacteria bacterium]
MLRHLMRTGLCAALAISCVLVLTEGVQAQQQQQRQQAPKPPAKPAAQPAAQPAAAPAPTGPLPSPIIAVVDVDRIRENSTAAKSVREQLEKQRSTFQDEISKQENDLRNAEQDLNKQRSVLSPEAFNQRRQQFEQRVAEVQRTVQARRRQLEGAMQSSMTQVNTAVVQSVQDIATARGATLVLPKSQIILVDKSMEVTDEVLTLVNRKLPTVKVTLPPLTQ